MSSPATPQASPSATPPVDVVSLAARTAVLAQSSTLELVKLVEHLAGLVAERDRQIATLRADLGAAEAAAPAPCTTQA